MRALKNKTEIRYLLSRWCDQEDIIEYRMKQNDYFETDTGEIWAFAKPYITRDIYYDDETESPLKENKHDGFINYNLGRNFDDFGISRWQEEMKDLHDSGCCSGIALIKPVYYRYRNDAIVTPMFLRRGWQGDEMENAIEIPEYEVQEIIDTVEELKQKYIKRLESYYKRYEDKIYAVGYWANR